MSVKLLLIYKRSRRPGSLLLPQRPAFSVSLSLPAPIRREELNVRESQQTPPLELPPFVPSWNQQRSTVDVDTNLPTWPGFSSTGQPSTPTLTGQYAWSTDQQSLSMSIMACEEGCASHSAAVHDAIRTLRAYQPTRGSWSTNEWNQEFSTWTLVPTVSPEPDGMSWSVLDPAQGIGRTPVARTMRDQELLMICELD